jgi:quercetin dioxygenase-like cupin family protein
MKSMLTSFVALATLALQQDPVKVAPETYKSILDNDVVRVLDVTVKAGAKVAQHAHPANVVYSLSDCKVRFADKDGKSADVEMKAGQTIWNEAQVHSSENLGKDLKALVVELKDPKKDHPPAEAPKGDDPVKLSAESYKVLLDNERVRVLDVHVKKGGKSALHSHPGYVVYALTDGKVKFTGADGKSALVEMKAGQALWRDAEAHSVENLGDDIHVLNIEVKPAKKK